MKVTQSCLTLCDLMDYTVHGILQARILEWVAFPFSRGSSHPRDWTQVSHIAGRFFTSWAIREAHKLQTITVIERETVISNLQKLWFWSSSQPTQLLPSSSFLSMSPVHCLTVCYPEHVLLHTKPGVYQPVSLRQTREREVDGQGRLCRPVTQKEALCLEVNFTTLKFFCLKFIYF